MDVGSRRRAIAEEVDRVGRLRNTELAAMFAVSAVTIHRDLDALEATGEIERFRGGARSVMQGHREVRSDFRSRKLQSVKEKAEIAESAVRRIEDGATMFLDSSTTAFALARRLEREGPRDLTIVTNNPAIGFLVYAPFVRIVLVPGEVNQSMRAITGPWAIDFLSGLEFDQAFISAAGLTIDSGFRTSQRDLSMVATTALQNSQRGVALIDAAKFNTPALVMMAERALVDVIITDSSIPERVLTAYRDAGYPVIVANGGPS